MGGKVARNKREALSVQRKTDRSGALVAQRVAESAACHSAGLGIADHLAQTPARPHATRYSRHLTKADKLKRLTEGHASCGFLHSERHVVTPPLRVLAELGVAHRIFGSGGYQGTAPHLDFLEANRHYVEVERELSSRCIACAVALATEPAGDVVRLGLLLVDVPRPGEDAIGFLLRHRSELTCVRIARSGIARRGRARIPHAHGAIGRHGYDRWPIGCQRYHGRVVREPFPDGLPPLRAYGAKHVNVPVRCAGPQTRSSDCSDGPHRDLGVRQPRLN
mmetsp:Transcript_7717/g.31373  ORF Transcript_7717/g.31373 Transcript_7717/m.31373 type:complete len:278 (-) Transcript_7717:1687-2520(-)